MNTLEIRSRTMVPIQRHDRVTI